MTWLKWMMNLYGGRKWVGYKEHFKRDSHVKATATECRKRGQEQELSYPKTAFFLDTTSDRCE
jgi:hypothetical protein